jgi:hypothetical protein
VSRRPAVDREQWPHEYTGPDTRWGLARGTPCRIVGHRAGGVRIKRASDGRTFVVGGTEVKRAA